METVYLRSFHQKLQRDRCGMGGEDRGQMCADRIPAHWRRTPFPDMLYVCVPPIDQLADQHPASPAAVLGSPCKKVELECSCGWRNLSWQYQAGREKEKPACCCLLLPEEAPLPALKEMVAKTIGATEEARYSTHLCHRGVGKCVWSAHDCTVSLRCQAS